MKKLILLLFICQLVNAQTKTIYTLAFYNTENLFDTKNDPKTEDDAFTPEGTMKWTQEKYEQKLNNIAYVVSQLGTPENKNGAAIVGLAEIENDQVLNDLITRKPIINFGYKYIHRDSPDRRGIDVALLYNPKYFEIKSSKYYTIKIDDEPNFRTREELLVTGVMATQAIAIIVNHWSSRLSEAAEAYREQEALVCKQICDSLQKVNPETKIIVMGDLNDNPQDKSCRRVLEANKDTARINKNDLYNPMWNLYEKGKGSICYKNKWDLFDQIIVSKNLLNKPYGLNFDGVEIFDRPFLLQQIGRKKNQPFSTFVGHKFMDGYSDHLPIVMTLCTD